MPKKKPIENNLTRLRKALDLPQSKFARKLGVSPSIIKKVEAVKRPITPDLSTRIFAETGVMLVAGEEPKPLDYSKADHAAWKKAARLDQSTIRAAERVITMQIELLLAASVRPGVDKGHVVYNALLQAVNHIQIEFRMEKHIDAELRDRQKTETKRYTVGELRKNDLLAAQVGFKDNPKLKDDEQIPLTKSVGWLPAREIFNIAWQHWEFLKEINGLAEKDLSEAQKARLAEIEKQADREVDAFLPQQSI